MVLSSTAIAPDTLHREHINGAQDTLIKTFGALAATNYTRGQFVTVGTTGLVTANATDDAVIDGVVYADVVNLTGAAGDKVVPVVVRGVVEADALIMATGGAFDDAFAYGTQCSVAGDSGTTAAEGQAVVAVASASNKQFTALFTHALPASGNDLVKGTWFFQGSDKFED